MPYACKVCAHLERASIDYELAKGERSMAAIARDHGLGKNTIARHAKAHLPGHLADTVRVFSGSIDMPAVGQLGFEYNRLYLKALDALAQAEAGTLHTLSDGSTVHEAPSVTSRVRAIREARAVLDSLVRLAGDAADESERPTGMAAGELTAAVAAQLERLRAERTALDPPHGANVESYELSGDVEEGEPLLVEEGGTTVSERTHRTSGYISVAAPVSAPPPIPLDTDAPISSTLSPATQSVIEADRRSTTLDLRTGGDVLFTVPNPGYPGSPAASTEERAASGYPDVEITVDDLRNNAELLATFAKQRLNLSTAPEVDEAAQ